MKKPAILFITIITVFYGCKKDVVTHSTDDPGHVKENLKSAKIVSASNQFAFGINRSFNQRAGDNNYFISPFSMVEALSMAYNGAGGNTKNQMAQVLGFSNYSSDEINNYNQSLAEALLSADSKVQFEIANSIWYRLGFHVLSPFISVNENYYGAEVDSLNFSSPEALSIINGWVNNKTHGKIPTILDEIPGDAVMYLINAIYFKGMWQYQFDSTKNTIADFYKEDGSIIQDTLMQLQQNLNYCHTDGYSAVELPYGNSAFNMVLVMPDTGKISDFIATLTGSKWSNLISAMKTTDVVVKMPKFHLELNTLLNQPLINLGMEDAFDPIKADFSGIDGAQDLFISRVIHKTYIDLSEVGTEAAAVTAIEFKISATPDQTEPKTQWFVANRPFVYAIVEKSTGVVLFLGKEVNPTIYSVDIQ